MVASWALWLAAAGAPAPLASTPAPPPASIPAPAPASALPTTAPVGPVEGTLVAPVAAPAPTTWLVPVGHTLGLLAGMRLGLSIAWPDAYDPLPLGRSGHQFTRAYTGPPEFHGDRALLESDGDPWAINVIGHGLFGAEIYGRVRQCGGGAFTAFAFTAGTSALWEYGIESFSKRPSGIDLVATPVIGAALGEARYQAQRWLRRRSPGFWRRLAEIVIDPLGETERGLLHTRC
jgi:hypothetical protein